MLIFRLILLFLVAMPVFADFFDDERIRNAPIFKNKDNGMWYLGAGGGVNLLNTIKFENIKPITFNKGATFSVLLGYKNVNSPIRHELNFSYIDLNVKTIQYQFGGTSFDLKTKSVKYYLMYNFLINTNDLFNSDYGIQLFFGPGVGVVLTQNSISSSEDNKEFNDYISKAKANGFGFAYDFSIGASLKLSDLWRGQMKIRYIIDNNVFRNGFGKIQSQIFLMELGIIFKVL